MIRLRAAWLPCDAARPLRPALAIAFAVLFEIGAPGQSPPASLPASRPTSLPSSSALEARLEAIRAKHGVPALGGAATTGDRLLAIAATGVRRTGSPEAVTVDDRWHLGSCTKSMTATMLARLVERGVLRWELTLAEAFPERVPNMHADYRPVTIEQLLAHRGGVPADLSAGGLRWKLWKREGTPTDQRRQLLDGLIARAPETRPGTKFIYANGGFGIAGHVAERAAGRSWEDLMRSELFDPLGMKDVGFGAPGRAGVAEHPWGHNAAGDPVEPGPQADNPPALGPAGTVHATLADWARYAAVHLLGARGKSGFLEPGTFSRLQARPAVGDYAFGWGHHERSWGNGDVLAHSGSNTMWFCVIWLAPRRDVAFLAVCNQGGEGPRRAADEAIGALIEAVRGELPPRAR